MSFTSVTVTTPMTTTTRYLSATLPPEPLKGSVVLDKKGLAWQRTGEYWSSAVSWGNDTRWLILLAESGPVRLLWEGPAPEPECAEEAVEKVDEVDEAEEPQIGSRVEDSEGDIWTRKRDGLWLYDGLGYSWSSLIREYGPIKILHRAEAKA